MSLVFCMMLIYLNFEYKILSQSLAELFKLSKYIDDHFMNIYIYILSDLVQLEPFY